MNSGTTKDIAMGTFAGSLQPRDLVTYYGILPDARSPASNPLICVYVSYRERTRTEDTSVAIQENLENQMRVIAAMHYRWAMVLPRREWFMKVPLDEKYLPILQQLKQNPLATVPSVAAQSILRAVKTPRIFSAEAIQLAEDQKRYYDAVQEFLAQVTWLPGSTNVTMWTDDQKDTNARLERFKLDLSVREREFQKKTQCSAGQIAGQMQPDEMVTGNDFGLVNVLNSAVFDAAYLPEPSDPLGRSAANLQLPQCPQSYEAFLNQYNPELKASLDSILNLCGPAPEAPMASAAPQYPPAMPSRLSDLGSPTSQTVKDTANAVLDIAIARCTHNATATDCTGLAPGTDAKIVKDRLEVIREFAHYEFAQRRLGRPDRAATSNVWRAVNKHLSAMESSN
jgi:hypothetical protein